MKAPAIRFHVDGDSILKMELDRPGYCCILKFLRLSCLVGKVFAFSERNRRFEIVDGANANSIALVFIF